jgi:hypothetical protein
MTRIRILAVMSVLMAGAVMAARPQNGDIAPAVTQKAVFSPLGFDDLHAFEQALPGTPTNPLFRQAAAATYWVYQGLARRGPGVDALSVWTTLGPETTLVGSGEENVSGRVSALAISPTCGRTGPCRLWVGTAGGGVWRSDYAMDTTDPGWQWVSHGLGTNNIGSLAVDTNDRTGNTIYVGTGETNQPNNSGAGTGLFKSIDGGDHWTRISTVITDPVLSPMPIDFTSTRGISTVVVAPNNPQTIYVATASAMLGMTAVRGGQTQTNGYLQPRTGLYKTDNGGLTWSLLWVPPLDPVVPTNPDLGTGVGDTMFGVRHVALDPKDPTIVYASAWNNAIHRSAPSLEGGSAAFKPVFGIVGFQRFRDLAMFALTVKDGHTRIYVYNGTDSLTDQSLYRVDNADVPASSLATQTGPTSYANGNAWIKLTSDNTTSTAGTSRRLCSTQCFYDLVVATPEGQPDTVILGGVATPTFGEPTIRSTDAGATFSGFGTDAQNPRNSSHVDVRAVVFHPRNSRIAWVGSDGGVVRNDGAFDDISNSCSALFGSAALCRTVLGNVPRQLYFLNKGLQTMQFYNVAVDPRDPLRRLIGGLQDNSTIWLDGTGTGRVWKTLFPYGDGTSASGFHPSRPEVLFASYQSNRFFTNFRSGDLSWWVRTDDPIRSSGERNTITQSTGRQFITFDPVNTDTQFTGFQHVWRTQNNGGDRTFLEANCRFPGGTSSLVCGDWVPLGAAASSPSTPVSGDLTSAFYGADRNGGLIVAAERTPADGGTLWAATNFGRLFVSTNADRPGREVEFERIDTPATPNRFITRIVADRSNPNVALVSYSGFNAITPGTPGHVFRVVFDPGTHVASFTSLDYDLGDMPVNTIAYDDVRGDLYAATDFGPLVLRQGSANWQVAGVGFPEALMVDLELVPDRRLLIAATHGIGIFYLALR